MSRGRKNGCPVSIKDWVVEVLDEDGSSWERVHGLDELEMNFSSSNEDGSKSSDLWEEPYINKRSADVSLSGRMICDEATGARDTGQEIIENYAMEGYCDADMHIRLIDPYGHGTQMVVQVSGVKKSADTGGSPISYDMLLVGEPIPLPYIQVSTIRIGSSGSALSSLTIDIADAPRVLQVLISPTTASNQRFKVAVGNRMIARVTGTTENSFTVAPLRVGTTTIRLSSVNGAKSSTITLNITRSTQPYETAVLGVGKLGLMILGRSST